MGRIKVSNPHHYDQMPIRRGARAVVPPMDYLAVHTRKAGAQRIEVIPAAIELERYRNPSSGEDVVFGGALPQGRKRNFIMVLKSF